jgi:uncharacterized protein YecE (DUF72 family)
MAKIFIGTSGYIYSHWEDGVFYPTGLPKSKKLEYYSKHFDTVELNSTFYRLPEGKTFESWYKRTPQNFIFALKAWRFITHIKKLKDCKDLFETFLKRALILKEKLGPILFQLPPFLKANFQVFEDFCQMVKKNSPKNLRFAFEFRNESWCKEEIYQILKKFNFAWVVVDSPSWPKVFKVCSDFVYVRMHGSKILFGSKYTKKELKDLAKKIKKWKKQNLDVYVYFNNDVKCYAVENAKELLKLCEI